MDYSFILDNNKINKYLNKNNMILFIEFIIIKIQSHIKKFIYRRKYMKILIERKKAMKKLKYLLIGYKTRLVYKC
jgi:hypothetical protein